MSSRAAVISTYSVWVGGTRYAVDGEAAILVTVSDTLTIIVPESESEPTRHIDVPLDNMGVIAIEKLDSQTQSQPRDRRVTTSLRISMQDAMTSNYYMNAAKRQTPELLLAFNVPAEAEKVQQTILQAHAVQAQSADAIQSKPMDHPLLLSDDVDMLQIAEPDTIDPRKLVALAAQAHGVLDEGSNGEHSIMAPPSQALAARPRSFNGAQSKLIDVSKPQEPVAVTPLDAASSGAPLPQRERLRTKVSQNMRGGDPPPAAAESSRKPRVKSIIMATDRRKGSRSPDKHSKPQQANVSRKVGAHRHSEGIPSSQSPKKVGSASKRKLDEFEIPSDSSEAEDSRNSPRIEAKNPKGKSRASLTNKASGKTLAQASASLKASQSQVLQAKTAMKSIVRNGSEADDDDGSGTNWDEGLEGVNSDSPFIGKKGVKSKKGKAASSKTTNKAKSTKKSKTKSKPAKVAPLPDTRTASKRDAAVKANKRIQGDPGLELNDLEGEAVEPAYSAKSQSPSLQSGENFEQEDIPEEDFQIRFPPEEELRGASKKRQVPDSVSPELEDEALESGDIGGKGELDVTPVKAPLAPIGKFFQTQD